MTRDDAVTAAGHVLAVARAQRDAKPVEQAARDAARPDGPSVTEIAQRLQALTHPA